MEGFTAWTAYIAAFFYKKLSKTITLVLRRLQQSDSKCWASQEACHGNLLHPSSQQIYNPWESNTPVRF